MFFGDVVDLKDVEAGLVRFVLCKFSIPTELAILVTHFSFKLDVERITLRQVF